MAWPELRAESPGRLLAEKAIHVGDIELPPGKLIVADPAYARRVTEPIGSAVLWISQDAVDDHDVFKQLRAAFPTTGLWPVMLTSLRGTRPWDEGELQPVAPSAIDAAGHGLDYLERSWAWFAGQGDETIAPLGATFPGMAPVRRCRVAGEPPAGPCPAGRGHRGGRSWCWRPTSSRSARR